MNDETDIQVYQDATEMSTSTEALKQVTARQTVPMATVQLQEEKKIKLTAKITNVPSGAYFRTGSRSYNLKSLIDGKFFLTKQTLTENTAWQIRAMYNDQNNATWYELGNNQWVEGTSLQIDIGLPELQPNKRPPLVTAVQNKENQPVTLPNKFKFTIDKGQNIEVWDSYKDTRKDTETYYRGAYTFDINRIAISNQHVTWLEVGTNQWIRLSIADLEDLGSMMNTTCLNPDPDLPKPVEVKYNLKLSIDNVPNGVYFRTGNQAYQVKTLTNDKFYLTNQSLLANTTWQIKRIYSDQNNNTWYDLGENQFVQGNQIFFDFGLKNVTDSKVFPHLVAVNNSIESQVVTLNSAFKFTIKDGNQLKVWNSYTDARKDTLTYYQGPYSFDIKRIAVSNQHITWLEIGTNQWVKLSLSSLSDLNFDTTTVCLNPKTVEDVNLAKLTMIMEKVPTGLVYTAKKSMIISTLKDNHWYGGGGQIRDGEKVAILGLSQDQNGDMWYRIGNNQWVPSDTVINIYWDNKDSMPVNLVDYESEIVVPEEAFYFEIKGLSYIFNTFDANRVVYKDKRIEKGTVLPIARMAMNEKNQLFGEIAKDEWIRLSGGDLDDLKYLEIGPIFETHPVPVKMENIITGISGVYFTAIAQDVNVLTCLDNNWVLNGQTIKNGQSIEVNKIAKDTDGNYFYDIGNNQWVSMIGYSINQIGMSMLPENNGELKIIQSTSNLSNQFVFPSNFKVALLGSQYTVWTNFDESRTEVKEQLNAGNLVHPSLLSLDVFNKPWLKVDNGKWIRLEGNEVEDIAYYDWNFGNLDFDFQSMSDQISLSMAELSQNMDEFSEAMSGFEAGDFDLENLDFSDLGNLDFSNLENLDLSDLENLDFSDLKNLDLSIGELNIEDVHFNQKKWEKTLNNLVKGLDIANKGMSKMVSTLPEVTDNFNGAAHGAKIANIGLSQMLSATNQMVVALNRMGDSVTGINQDITVMNSEMKNYKSSLFDALSSMDFVNNLNFNSNDITDINASDYLQKNYKDNHDAFLAHPINGDSIVKVKEIMDNTQSILNSLSFLVGGTVEVIGGAAATVTGIMGVSGGYVMVSLATGGTALVALPGVIAVNGALAVTGTAVMTKGIDDLVNGVTTTQFNNGDRPESRTFAKAIEGKLNGKKVHYRVDAEPQGHKLQIQCNEDKAIDIRIKYDNINSIEDALREIPNSFKRNLTQGKLQEMAKAVYRAAQSLK